MKSLLPSLEKEVDYLQRIPAFHPQFRQAYGQWGLVAIGVVAFFLLCLGIWWLAPCNSGYLPQEKRNIWFGVAVMPFASLLAAAYMVEFILKLVHIALWAGMGMLVVPREGKIAAWMFAVLAIAAFTLPVIRQEWDLWSYLATFLSIPILYAFLHVTWTATYSKAASFNQLSGQ